MRIKHDLGMCLAYITLQTAWSIFSSDRVGFRGQVVNTLHDPGQVCSASHAWGGWPAHRTDSKGERGVWRQPEPACRNWSPAASSPAVTGSVLRTLQTEFQLPPTAAPEASPIIRLIYTTLVVRLCNQRSSAFFLTVAAHLAQLSPGRPKTYSSKYEPVFRGLFQRYYLTVYWVRTMI